MATAKSTKRGTCAFVVQGRKTGETFYDKEYKFPVSWRGRDAAARMVRRKGYDHAVMGLDCGVQVGGSTGGRNIVKLTQITLVSCNKGKCEVLGGSSNKRQEHKHRTKARYNRTIAGWK